jgi:hypothetical protein
MKWKKYYWLDISALSQRLVRNDVETSFSVKYFTSRVLTDAHEQKRQNTYLEALETLKNVEIQYGNFTSDLYECFRCHKTHPVYHEKQTDVNIAAALLIDAQEDRFDDAILVTADSDQVGPVRHITECHPDKRVIVAYPPGRHSADLEPPVSTKSFHLQRKEFEECQLPPEVKSKNGFMLQKPISWV